jgi:hypothetical protein
LHPRLRKNGVAERPKVPETGLETTETKFFQKCKVLEKRFAGFKKMIYLCSPFALQMCGIFSTRFFELLVY